MNSTDLLTPAETAELLRVEKTTLEQWRGQRRGPKYIKLGGGSRSPVRYKREDVEAYLRENEYLTK